MLATENLETFELLWTLENGIRELIITRMEPSFGPRWYKSRLPGDVLAKYQAGLAYDRGVRWLLHVSHHPIYYIDFGDLPKILFRADNWRDVFASTLRHKESIQQALKDVDPIRNKVAHNRRCVAFDRDMVSTAISLFDNLLGSEGPLAAMAAHTSALNSIDNTLRSLRLELEKASDGMQAGSLVVAAKVRQSLDTAWWFDATYLAFDITPVSEFLLLLRDYQTLSRGRGSGPAIQRWIATHDVRQTWSKCDHTLGLILEAI